MSTPKSLSNASPHPSPNPATISPFSKTVSLFLFCKFICINKYIFLSLSTPTHTLIYTKTANYVYRAEVWQTTASRPNLAKSVHTHMYYLIASRLQMASWKSSSCNRDCMARKVKNIYCLVFYQKKKKVCWSLFFVLLFKFSNIYRSSFSVRMLVLPHSLKLYTIQLSGHITTYLSLFLWFKSHLFFLFQGLFQWITLYMHHFVHL